MNLPNSVEQIYDTMAGTRNVVVERVEEYATWTLPSIFPRSGNNESDELQNDVQSFGAQAVNHLSNKLMVGLFSPSKSFFRLEATQEFKDTLALQNVTEEMIQTSLQGAETEAIKELARLGAREPFTLLLQLLIITGNALLHFPADGTISVYSMRDYVIKRDITGFPIRIIIHDAKKLDTLPPEVQDELLNSNPNLSDGERDTKLYTDCVWDRATKKYYVNQYADDVKLTTDKTQGVYTIENMPYVPLVWKIIRGQDWGKGLVEDYAGDYHSLSTAERSSLEIVGIISQIKGLIDPAGMTDVNEMNSTANGQWCSGRADDVEMLTFSELNDKLTTLEAYIDKKERRLSKAFLMDSAGVRDAERVTAEEIRLVARDLEMALGGVYTRLAQTFQLPIARLLLLKIDFNIKGEEVEPIIITGLNALSRSGDLDSFRMFVQDVSLLAGIDPEVRALLSFERLVTFVATNNNIPLDVALKTVEEKQADQQAIADSQQQEIEDEVRMKAEPQLLANENGAQQ